jgi:hypothetical protein
MGAFRAAPTILYGAIGDGGFPPRQLFILTVGLLLLNVRFDLHLVAGKA